MDAELFDDARAHALLDLLLHLLRRGALDLELGIVRLPDKGAVRELLDAEGELERVVAGVGCHACGILARVRPGGHQGLYASLTLFDPLATAAYNRGQELFWRQNATWRPGTAHHFRHCGAHLRRRQAAATRQGPRRGHSQLQELDQRRRERNADRQEEPLELCLLQHALDEREREPHHVVVISLDLLYPLRGSALDGVRAGFVHRLAG